jgi:hypothetical protein
MTPTTAADVLTAADTQSLPAVAAAAEELQHSLLDDESPLPQSSPNDLSRKATNVKPAFSTRLSSVHAKEQTSDQSHASDQSEQSKLESYNTYAIVASMIMGTSFSIVTMVDFTLLNATRPAYVLECHPSDEQECSMDKYTFFFKLLRIHCTDYLTYAVIVCSSLSLVSAVYASMIFNFTVIYSKVSILK